MYAIGRVYNKHGISDYFNSWDESGDKKTPCFTGKGAMVKFHSFTVALQTADDCKLATPAIIGGFPCHYHVVEV